MANTGDWVDTKASELAEAIVDHLQDMFIGSLGWMATKAFHGAFAVSHLVLPTLAMIGLLLWIAGWEKGAKITGFSLLGYLFMTLIGSSYGF